MSLLYLLECGMLADMRPDCLSSMKVVYSFAFLLSIQVLLVNGSEMEEVVDTISDTIPSECIILPEESCPNQESVCPCVSLVTPTTLLSGYEPSSAIDMMPKPSILCCHLNGELQLKTGLQCSISKDYRNPTALHVRNSTIGSAALSHASEFLTSLTSLAITEGISPIITGRLSEIVPKLSCLNLRGNGLGNLPEEVLRDLSTLRALDLSANNVTKLPRLPHITDGQTLWIDISGNPHLGCSGILDAMSQNASSSSPLDFSSSPLDSSSPPLDSSSVPPLDTASPLPSSLPGTQIYFHNMKNTSCITPKGLGWFNWTQRIYLDDIEYLTKLVDECPSGEGYTCLCATLRHDIVPGRPPVLSISVDCSGRSLTDLPLKLPKHTVLLNVSNNNISSLEPLGRNRYYSEIREFYADNNCISSIEVLEGSQFLIDFQRLSLSGNKLKELPMYIIQSIFERNMIYRYMKLGKNKYNCDCNTYHGLRVWLLQNKKNINDYEEMVCAGEEPPIKIIDLQKEKVCLHKTDWMDYLPLVVMAEVLLLIALVSKVSYDYWIFKTKGYLPWPASRTPKLPCCDWAFDA